jgi:hypothetical protein
LLIDRHKLVGILARAKNGLQHLMLNRGVQMKRNYGVKQVKKRYADCPGEGGLHNVGETC